MTEQNFRHGDDELRSILKRYDPSAPLEALDLLTLETAIFARIDNLARPQAPSFPPLLLWIVHQNWADRATAFAALLVLALGLVAGQAVYTATNAYAYYTASYNAPSLLAFADETTTSWGDIDDNAE